MLGIHKDFDARDAADVGVWITRWRQNRRGCLKEPIADLERFYGALMCFIKESVREDAPEEEKTENG
jgi:hypothetical protein